jgi:hypothetical protein
MFVIWVKSGDTARCNLKDKVVQIDIKDLHKVAGHKIYIISGKYAAIGRSILLHRLVLNAEPGQIIDHINRDTFDNRKINLRQAGRKGNAMNSIGHKDRKSPFRGVYWDRVNNVWEVTLWMDGKNKFHKRYNKLTDAINARLLVERKYFKSFAPTGPDAGPFAITPSGLKEALEL